MESNQIKSDKLEFKLSELTEEHKREMEKHANFSQNTISSHYDEVCTNYEDIYLMVGYNDPRKIADHVISNQQIFKDKSIEEM